MKTNLFIAGFSKCGTTSLYDILADTPAVAGGNSKEPGYFSTTTGKSASGSDLDWSTGGSYASGDAWYAAVFKGCDAPYQIDASTIYGFDPASPKLIHDYNPDAKIIFIVRDPYTRIESHYFQESKTGMKLPPFEAFIQSDHDRLTFYKEVTRFRKTIERYRALFPDENILVLALPMLKDQPALKAKVGAFLGVELETPEASGQTASNRRKAARSPGLKRLLIAIERSKFARLSPRWVQRAGSKLFRKFDKVLLKEVKDKPKVDPERIDAIREEFRADMDYLEREFGVTLDRPNPTSTA